jgi:hypothetical protein
MNLKITSMKSLSRFLISFFVVFSPFAAVSQQVAKEYPLVELRGLDTLIVFEIGQGRKLAVFNEERKKLQSIVALQNSELSQKDSVIMHQGKIIEKYVLIDQAHQIIVDEKSKQIALCDEQQNLLTSELKKQKRYKYIAIISGVSLNLLTLWTIMKP